MSLTAFARGSSNPTSRGSATGDAPSRRTTELTLAQEKAGRASTNDKSETANGRSAPTSTFGREQKKSQFKRVKPVAEDQKGLYLVLQDATYTFMVKTNAGFCLDLLQTVLSLVACILYVVETYMEMEGPYPESIVTTEWVLAGIFLFDYLLHMFISENALQYFLSTGAMTDLFAIIPVVSFVPGVGSSFAFLRVLKIFRVMRILRIYRVFANNDEDGGQVTRQIYILVFTMISFAFVGAGTVHSWEQLVPGSFRRRGDEDCNFDSGGYFRGYVGTEYEKEYWAMEQNDLWDWPAHCKLTFFDAFYFIFTTVSTIGFGDIYPETPSARVVVIIIMATLMLVLPPELSKLSDLIANSSVYSFVLVCGQITYANAKAFLTEFYHDDHGEQRMQVVFLSKREPDEKMKALLLDPFFDDKVQYVRGSLTKEADLVKSRYSTSNAVFILSDQFTPEPQRADMQALVGIKCMKDLNTEIPIFCQIILSRNKIHNVWSEWNHLLCIQDFKMGILAKAVLCPGFATMIANLVCSSADWEIDPIPEEEEQARKRKKRRKRKRRREKAKMMQSLGENNSAEVAQEILDDSDDDLEDDEDSDWISEYMHGYGQEIYCLPLADCFVNQPFSHVSNTLYQEHGLCVFALDTETSAERKKQERLRKKIKGKKMSELRRKLLLEQNVKRQVLMNPKHYFIRSRDRAFIIADDIEQAREVTRYVPKQGSKHKKKRAWLLKKMERKKLERKRMKRRMQSERARASEEKVQVGGQLADANMELELAHVKPTIGDATAVVTGTALSGAIIASSHKSPSRRSAEEYVGESSGTINVTEERKFRDEVSKMDTTGGGSDNSWAADSQLSFSTSYAQLPETRKGTPTHSYRAGQPGSMLPGSGAATGQSENKVANGERNFKVEEDSKLGDGPQWDILKRISSKYGETIYSRQDVTRIFGASGSQVLGSALGIWGDPKLDSNPAHAGAAAPTWEGHIIVCGGMDSLMQLLLPMRASTSKTIVLLNENKLPDHEWAHIRDHIGNVEFVVGSPLDADDLARCDIKTASVILIRSYTLQKDATMSDEDMKELQEEIDLQGIFAVCFIEASYTCRVLLEIQQERSMAFLKFSSTHAQPKTMWPQFASGQVFIPSMLDTLLCQSFYNERLLYIIFVLINGKHDMSQEQGSRVEEILDGNPHEVCGRQSARATPSARERDKEKDKHTYYEGLKLVQMKIPRVYLEEEHTYGEIYAELLLTKSILPIGVFRSPLHKKAPLPYVITNPKKDMVLKPYDRLLVLVGDNEVKTKKKRSWGSRRD